MSLLKRYSLVLFLLVAGGLPSAAFARGVYMTPEQFLSHTFQQDVPKPKAMWLIGEKKKRLTDILGHKPSSSRLRYWQKGQRTAWIMDEIGKVMPITMGVVINNGRLESIRVLEYRESRGAEIRFPAFRQQFHTASLSDGDQLDRNIDGISGATMSVTAMKKIARAALMLHASATK